MIRFRQSAIAAAGWARRLALLLIAVIAIFPALSLAAAAHGYDLVPAGSHAGHTHDARGAAHHPVPAAPHHHAQDDNAADAGPSLHTGDGAGDGAGYDQNCCDACQIAAGLIVAATEPVAAPRSMRIVRLSEATPPGEPVSAPPEPPRT